jgi:hypothetical protein
MPGVHVVPVLADALPMSYATRCKTGGSPMTSQSSQHTGAKWGYPVPADQVGFAHHIIDGGIDLAMATPRTIRGFSRSKAGS